jgi:hypothetical protein
MKIFPVEAELFHADRLTDGHDDADSRFPPRECAYKAHIIFLISKCDDIYSVFYVSFDVSVYAQ